MARKRVVSRTIKTTKVTALLASKERGECYNAEFKIMGDVKNPEKIVKFITPHLNDDEVIVDLVKFELLSDKYAMPEEEFVSLANIITE